MKVRAIRFKNTAGYPRRYGNFEPKEGQAIETGEGLLVLIDGSWRLVPWSNIDEVIYYDEPFGIDRGVDDVKLADAEPKKKSKR